MASEKAITRDPTLLKMQKKRYILFKFLGKVILNIEWLALNRLKGRCKMKVYSKKEKKKLRELADLAYERELNNALNKLEEKFVSWKKGSIGSFELSHEIHLYHNGISQELYKKYNYSDLLDLTVGWAIANNILKKEEVGEGLLNKLEIIINEF